MRKRTPDGLREITLQSEHGGREYFVVVGVYPDTEPGTLAKSAHVFGTYGSPNSTDAEWPGILAEAMHIWRELCARSECDGLLNWETANMALEIKHDGANYADRLRWFDATTELGNTVCASAMQNFAEIHGYLQDKAPAFLELVDWVDIAHWFENERNEWTRYQ